MSGTIQRIEIDFPDQVELDTGKDDSAIAQLRQENTRLRAALAVSKSPCLYCQLPADEMAKCRSGFPGCDRADDLMGCPELGARLEVEDLKKRLASAEAALKPFSDKVVSCGHMASRYDAQAKLHYDYRLTMTDMRAARAHFVTYKVASNG